MIELFTTYNIIIAVLGILNVTLVYTSWNVLRKVERYEDDIVKLLPSKFNDGFELPPNVNVALFKLNSEPAVVVKLLDCIFPVLTLPPSIVVEF